MTAAGVVSGSETKGGQTARGEGLKVYPSVNLSMFARGVYICDMI